MNRMWCLQSHLWVTGDGSGASSSSSLLAVSGRLTQRLYFVTDACLVGVKALGFCKDRDNQANRPYLNEAELKTRKRRKEWLLFSSGEKKGKDPCSQTSVALAKLLQTLGWCYVTFFFLILAEWNKSPRSHAVMFGVIACAAACEGSGAALLE